MASGDWDVRFSIGSESWTVVVPLDWRIAYQVLDRAYWARLSGAQRAMTTGAT
ncbi:MAG TPA: hypothetical protein VF003_08880 [Pseudonocardiaceae bacterium]